MTINADQKPGCLFTLQRLLGFGTPYTAEETPLQEAGGTQEALPYRVRDDFLTPAELSFYHVLLTALKGRAVVSAKVGLSELFYIVRPNENYAYRNHIQQKHVDFVICEPATMRPLAAIELDDSSHQRTDRQERDRFVEEIFETAGLPLLRVPARREYALTEIDTLVAPHLSCTEDGEAPEAAEVAAEDEGVEDEPAQLSAKDAPEVPVCPRCGEPMILRTAHHGARQGEQFYGCPNYPHCRETQPLAQAR